MPPKTSSWLAHSVNLNSQFIHPHLIKCSDSLLSYDLKFLNTTMSFTHNYKKLGWLEHNFNHNFYHVTKTFIIIIIATITVITFWMNCYFLLSLSLLLTEVLSPKDQSIKESPQVERYFDSDSKQPFSVCCLTRHILQRVQ